MLLALLGAAAEQNNHPLAVLAEINPVAGAEIDPHLEHAGTNAFDVRDIAQGQPGQSGRHFRGGWGVQSVKPNSVKVAALPIEIFANLIHYSNTYDTIINGY